MSIGARRAGLVMLLLAVVAGAVMGQDALRKKGKRADLLPYKSGVPFVVTIKRNDNSAYTNVTGATCRFRPASGGGTVTWPLAAGKIKLHPNRRSVTLVFLPPARMGLPVPGKGLPSGQLTHDQRKHEYSTMLLDEPGTIIVTIEDSSTPDDPTDPIPVDPIDFDPCAP